MQAADDEVLKAMNRKYKIEDFIELCNYIKKAMPYVNITTDYIVAFGQESDKQFNNSLANLKKIKFGNMNVFIYSRRKGTVADKLYKKDINPIIARERYNKIFEIKQQINIPTPPRQHSVANPQAC